MKGTVKTSINSDNFVDTGQKANTERKHSRKTFLKIR